MITSLSAPKAVREVSARSGATAGGAARTTSRPLTMRPLVPSTRTAATKGSGGEKSKEETVTGITFQPMEEVAPVLRNTRQTAPTQSFARSHFAEDLEGAVNEQINVEYTVSYIYHSMSAFFDRDNISLPGLAKYFRDSSAEERTHAQKLIDFQNTRGGRVCLATLSAPLTEYHDEQKGDALYAMELALSLEKLNYDKLLALWQTADRTGDPQATQFIEDLLDDQVQDVKKAADYVSQLRRVGKGLGVWQFDHELYESEIRARTQ